MMLISTDGNCIVNSEYITKIYIGSNLITIKAEFCDGTGCQIGAYQSQGECRMALRLLAERIGKEKLYSVPQTDEARARMIAKEKWHHATGKKTKGHGGS